MPWGPQPSGGVQAPVHTVPSGCGSAPGRMKPWEAAAPSAPVFLLWPSTSVILLSTGNSSERASVTEAGGRQGRRESGRMECVMMGVCVASSKNASCSATGSRGMEGTRAPPTDVPRGPRRSSADNEVTCIKGFQQYS